SYTDAGATASDSCDTSLTTGTATGSVDVNTPGTYTITYNATDASGNHADAVTRTVIVSDTTKPVITLTGSTPVTVECHTSYTDAGATASDSCDTSLTTATATGSVDVNTPGTYTITYNATDASGNHADAVTRTVIVSDTTKPVITLTGSTPVTVECHTSYTDAGATASDSCDTSLTTATATGSVDVNTPGTYTITYNATDASGNHADAVTRTVIVSDTTKPVITLTGSTPVTVECHTSYTDAGATASDSCDTSLTTATATGSVDVNTPGTYTITYNATDASGNHADAVTRTVIVSDTTKPVITLTGSTPV